MEKARPAQIAPLLQLGIEERILCSASTEQAARWIRELGAAAAAARTAGEDPDDAIRRIVDRINLEGH